MSKNLFKNKWFFKLIGIGLFAFILSGINLGETFTVLAGLNIYYFLIAIAIMLLGSIIRPYRWKYILSISDIDYPFWKTYKLYFIGLFLGIITPGRVGEAGKIFYLKKDNHPTSRSLMTIVIDRLADLVYLIIFGYLGLFIFFNLFQKLILILTITIITAVILIFAIIKIRGIKNLLKKIVFSLLPVKYRSRFQGYLYELLKALKFYKSKNYLIIFFLTMLCWVPSYVSLYFLANSVFLQGASFLYLAVSLTIASLITLLPISMSGLGTREAALLLLFSPLHIATENIIAFSLLIFFANFVSVSIIGLWFWVRNPLHGEK